MRKFIIILFFLFLPVMARASVDCTFQPDNLKSSYVPGEIITFNMGFNDLENKTIKSLQYYIKYDSYYLEIIDNYDLLKNEDSINYVSIKKEINDLNIKPTVQFKVKHKVPSTVTLIDVLDSDNYKTNIVSVLEEGDEDILYCTHKKVNLKIDNKKDDASLSKVKLTLVGNDTIVKEIISFDSLDLVIDNDVTKVVIEAECSGEKCLVKVHNEIEIIDNYTEIPIVVETENSIRNYYLGLTKSENSFEEEKEEISNMIINEDVNSYDSMRILIIFVIIVFIIVSGSIVFIIYANKKI